MFSAIEAFTYKLPSNTFRILYCIGVVCLKRKLLRNASDLEWKKKYDGTGRKKKMRRINYLFLYSVTVESDNSKQRQWRTFEETSTVRCEI